VVDIGAKSKQDTGGIAVLKGKTELDTQEADTHVPDLPESKGWS
jgi:hypothetical protein